MNVGHVFQEVKSRASKIWGIVSARIKTVPVPVKRNFKPVAEQKLPRVNKSKMITEYMANHTGLFTVKSIFTALREQCPGLTLSDVGNVRTKLMTKGTIRRDHMAGSSDTAYRVMNKHKNPGFNMRAKVYDAILNNMGDKNLAFEIDDIVLVMKKMYFNVADFDSSDISNALSSLKKEGKLTSRMKGSLHIYGHIWGIINK